LLEILPENTKIKLIKKVEPSWVSPMFVAEISFADWTNAGMLRHPRFPGLRRHKPAKQVVREG
jgi:ATP-dependent DNA ligase